MKTKRQAQTELPRRFPVMEDAHHIYQGSVTMTYATTTEGGVDVGFHTGKSGFHKHLRGVIAAAMVFFFVVYWPIGLALLAYLLWSKNEDHGPRRRKIIDIEIDMGKKVTPIKTGNTAFDNYKTETMRRLEEEQHNFEAFLARLREARDKTEFDQFLDDRAKAITKYEIYDEN
jgi:hypothetical protein